MQILDIDRAKFEYELKNNGLRLTHVRIKIFELLVKSNKPLSIKDICQSLTDVHFVSVYRSINSMQKASIVKQLPSGFKNLFELSEKFKPHHHHITCENCGKTTEVNDERIESLMTTLAIESGVKPTKHHFEIYGVCNTCRD